MSLDARRWLVEPAVPDVVRFPIATSPVIKFTPEIYQMLENLALGLEKEPPISEGRPINCPIISVEPCGILIICTGVTAI